MRKALKILGGIVAVLAVVVAVILGYVTVAYDALWTKTFDIPQHAITVISDEASLIEGRRLLKARGCTDCHMEDLGGKYFVDDPML